MKNQREIKFRVWDGEEMIYEGWNKEVYYNRARLYSLGSHQFKILLEYTGLKDKNGKDIYEGDILRDIYGYEDVPYLYYEVVFGMSIDRRWGFYLNNYNACSSVDIFNKLEVVGNVHKNPELLN